MPKTHYARGRGAALSRIFIAVPSYAGGAGAPFLASLFESVQALDAAGIAADFAIEAGNCHIDDARNSLVTTFLETDCTDLVFIDADVGWRASDLVKLVQYDRDVVAGIYPKKQEKAEFPVRALPGERMASPDGLVEVEGVPTGFLRIRRSVLERLAEKAPKFIGSDGREYPLIFERTLEAGHRWSGDYAFCRKWKAAGGKIYVDPEMFFTHEGAKEWEGRLGDFWRRRAGLEPERFVRALRAVQADRATAEDYVTLSEAWGNEWAAPPGFLAAAAKFGRKHQPVLECGSGLSTLVLGAMGVEVHSLEHDLGWYRRVKGALERYGLTSVTLTYAPLDRAGWYTSPFGPNTEFGMVLIDGPPRAYGRDGLFHVLGHAIANAVWLMDDADDPAQLAMLEAEAAKLGRTVDVLDAGRKIALSKPGGSQ